MRRAASNTKKIDQFFGGRRRRRRFPGKLCLFTWLIGQTVVVWEKFQAPFISAWNSYENHAEAKARGTGAWVLIASVPAATDNVWIDYLLQGIFTHLIKKLEECDEVWSDPLRVDPFTPLPPKGQSSRAGTACVLVPCSGWWF